MMMSLLHRRDMMTLLRALLLVLHSLSTKQIMLKLVFIAYI